MSRRARIILPGVPHHVVQRGNRRTAVFSDDSDRLMYLHFLRKYSTLHDLKIWAYVLMTNHIHLIAVPQSDNSLSLAFRDIHGTYATVFNKKHGWTGHLWQSRFYSCVLDDRHLCAAVRYVERNPVRAGLVIRAEDYPWSSAPAHMVRQRDPYLDDELPFIHEIENWSAWLSQAGDDSGISEIRDATATGRVCGTEDFVRQVEISLGRSLLPQKRGRKKIRGQLGEIRGQ